MKKSIFVLASTFVFSLITCKPTLSQSVDDYLFFTSTQEGASCSIPGQSDSCWKQSIYEVDQETGESSLVGEWNNPYGDGDVFYDVYTEKLVVGPGNDWDLNPVNDGDENYGWTPKFAVWDRNNPSSGVTFLASPKALMNSDDADSVLIPFSPGAISSPVTVKPNGDIHIGENSLITRERDGVQQLYATDSNSNPIDIDITNGSDLLINGKSVQGQIDENTKGVEANREGVATNKRNIKTNRQNISTNAGNIETNSKNISTNAGNIKTNRKNIDDLGYGVAGATALTAALSSLPTTADDSPISCGIGTGGYSSRFAMGIGCASRLSDRLSVNVGGSHVFGGSSSYGGGSLDTVAARGGFVFKLGTIHKRSNIDGEELQSQLDELKRENSSIREENKELIARLERLEAIALGRESSITRASLK